MNKLMCVQVELTNNCNYNCTNCPRSPDLLTRPKGFMAPELFEQVMEECFEVAESVNFSFFGEPTLHPNFLYFMEYLKKRPKNFKVVINSNMSLMTKVIFDKLIDIKLDNLRISLDAANEDTYSKVRPTGKVIDLDGIPVDNSRRFETICDKTEYWFKLPNHTSSRHVYVVSSKNKHEIPSFIEKWHPLLGPADVILTKSVLTYGGKIQDEEVTAGSCNVWSQKMLTVDWCGNVSPCNLDTNMDLIIGNIKEVSLSAMWENSEFKRLKKLSEEREVFPCNKCIDSNNWSKNKYITKEN